jgi:hypothetical protein
MFNIEIGLLTRFITALNIPGFQDNWRTIAKFWALSFIPEQV